MPESQNPYLRCPLCKSARFFRDESGKVRFFSIRRDGTIESDDFNDSEKAHLTDRPFECISCSWEGLREDLV